MSFKIEREFFMHVLLTIVCLVAIAVILGATNDWHRKQTGVNMPSRNAMQRIRRNARQKGISRQAAYDQWLRNKQRRRRL
jgi:hypothetical protein